MKLIRIASGFTALAILLSIAGCGDNGQTELSQWMAQVKKDTKVNVPKLSEPKKFIPYSYSQVGATDPFNQSKLTVAIAKALADKKSPFAPDRTRQHEPLEAFPLDAISMVGAISAIKERSSGQHAVVLVDKTLYNVKVGDYLGQSDGRITAITESEIAITERVQDASGEWVERKTTLELQENRK